MQRWLDVKCVIKNIQLHYPDAKYEEKTTRVHGIPKQHTRVFISIPQEENTIIPLSYYADREEVAESQCRYFLERVQIPLDTIIKDCCID